MFCLETANLTHKFSEQDVVLKNISLQVPTGSIYGFLGPNGAGKTTTLRLVLGLLKKQQGSIKIFNKPFDAHRIEILKNLGSLIESPSLYGHLTATENLQILQKVYRCFPQRIPEVLEIVGLQNTGNKKASNFSLGMKQRLSIAIALLHNPSLLILDEPTNGLDPNGVIEIRDLLKKLNRQQGITVVISSHLLSEIEKLVTHLGIIHKGNVLFQGTLNELREKQTLSSIVAFDTSNPEKTAGILRANGFAVVSSKGQVTIPVMEKEKIGRLNSQLVQSGVEVYQIIIVKHDLESIFIDLINSYHDQA
jgi:ABC-type multidrug transport system ATPase subunit